MATLQELRQVRIDKLNQLKELGINPYPADSNKNTTNNEICENYNTYEGRSVIVAGRVMSIRSFGKLVFIKLQDASGYIQAYIRSGELEKENHKNSELSFNELELLDVADFIEVAGKVTKTKKGEISVAAIKVRILTKALRPLPEKWEGLKDREERMRRRYVDTVVNRDVFERFLRRAKFWQAHREFFKENGFVEMNIPVLEQVPGGGDAKPFITHMESIGQDFYLRISQELYLKRLIGGGYEKVFEIGPRFRNEGLSNEHLPEHIAMEFYWAYADMKDGMKFIKKLYDYILEKVYGKKQFKIRGFDVDFSKGWKIIDFNDIVHKKYGIDVYKTNVDELKNVFKEHNLKVNFEFNKPRAVDNLWKQIRKDIAGPAFLINHPKYLSPLQKASVDNSNIVERFQPIIAGSELGNGWSEVNDAIDQFERFNEQQKLRDAGDAEAQWLDIDYVEMLEYGMPPTFGWGHSERLFWFLEDVPATEGVPFPQLKEHISDTTREIYHLPKPKDENEE